MYSKRSDLDLSDEAISGFKISITVENYNEKTSEYHRICYVSEKNV